MNINAPQRKASNRRRRRLMTVGPETFMGFGGAGEAIPDGAVSQSFLEMVLS